MMARGDCQTAFAAAAADDGVLLSPASASWVNQRGHLGLPEQARQAVGDVLQAMFDALGGDPVAQAAKPPRALPGDFIHAPSGTFVEVDELQHFTSFRALTLTMYPGEVALGFDLDEYVDLCSVWAVRADRYRAGKAAAGFGPGGRQRQRAFHDALRDLVVPAMGHPPLVRAAAPQRDGAAAYQRVRERLPAATHTSAPLPSPGADHPPH